MRWLGKERFRFFRGQSGFSLIEVLVAVAILAAIGVSLLNALDTNYRATRTLDEQVVAANLATAYHEIIKGSVYDNAADPYSSVGDNITRPSDYSVDIDVDYSDDGISWGAYSGNQTLQRITVVVSREGKYVLSICTYRAER